MSYHLALRGLLASRCAAPRHQFADCLHHTLRGDIPATVLHNEMQLAAHQSLSVTSLSTRIAELLETDLNPLGQILRLAQKERTYHEIWHHYNRRGNVIHPTPFGKRAGAEHTPTTGAHHSRSAAAPFRLHADMLDAYRLCLDQLQQDNQSPQSRQRQQRALKLSVLASQTRASTLVHELCEFFEAFPHTKVQDACTRLGVHPRWVERLMHEQGITAGMIKRASMLTQASVDILCTPRELSDIAQRCGYSDGAHLSKAFSQATGGIQPSQCRRWLN